MKEDKKYDVEGMIGWELIKLTKNKVPRSEIIKEIMDIIKEYCIPTPDPWDHISPEYREGVTCTLRVDKSGNWYIKNDLLKGTAAARGEMGDVDRDGEKKTVRQGVWV